MNTLAADGETLSCFRLLGRETEPCVVFEDTEEILGSLFSL